MFYAENKGCDCWNEECDRCQAVRGEKEAESERIRMEKDRAEAEKYAKARAKKIAAAEKKVKQLQSELIELNRKLDTAEKELRKARGDKSPRATPLYSPSWKRVKRTKKQRKGKGKQEKVGTRKARR
tara:strand:+ start:812 stop:1192 length:381 start_codon:yes stop_codon:yes gene_type:complete